MSTDPIEGAERSDFIDGKKITKWMAYKKGKLVSFETEVDQRKRITLALITSEDPTKVDTEWVTWFDIDFCISQRFFGWDRGKEIWFTQRFSYLLALTDLTEDQQAEKTLIIEWYEAKEKYKEFIKSLNK